MARRKRLKIHVKRLRNAIRESYDALSPFREVRTETIRDYCGQWYGDGSYAEAVPLNMLEEAVGIYTRLMAARKPGVLVKTPWTNDPKLRTEGYLLKEAITHTVEKIALVDELKSVAKDALFCMGISQTGVTPAVEEKLRGMHRPSGLPFVERISMHDWAHDMTSKRWSQCAWFANRYELPYEEMRDSKLFGRKTSRLKPTEDGFMDLGREKSGDPSKISRGEGYLEGYKEKILLWDVYLPGMDTVVTIPDSEEGFEDEELDSYKWTGLDGGPYRRLWFNEVPDQTMPLPPTNLWLDLHHVGNRLLNKIINQAQRQKDLLLYQPGAGDDAKRLIDAQDGEGVRTNRPESAKEVSLGGVRNESLAMFLQIKQMFSDSAGNLDLLGGISPQSETATQDQILNANASRRAQAMMEDYEKYVKGVCEDLGYIIFTDPSRALELELETGIEGRKVPFTWRDSDRVGDFFQHHIEVVPFSTRDKLPQETLDVIMKAVREAIPLSQIDQSFTINTQRLFETIAEQTNTPELLQIIEYRTPGQYDGLPTANPSQPPKPAVTTRNEVRRSIPGTTRAGNDGILSQALLTGGVQPKEAAAVGRGR